MYQNQSKGLVGRPECSTEDPMSKMTCGENLERKIAEQKERLSMLEDALEEMKTTGLYNVKISTLRDTMTW